MSTTVSRISIAEYHDMAEKGLLRPDSKDYLWHGEIVEVMTQKPPHASTVQNVADRLRELFPRAEWTVREEKPLPLPDDTEPIPDVIVARGHKSAFVARHPRLDEVVLVAEVAHTTLRTDVGEKLADYAAAGIPLYLVADVEGQVLLAFWDPDREGGAYRSSRVCTRGQAADTPAGPIRVEDVFP